MGNRMKAIGFIPDSKKLSFSPSFNRGYCVNQGYRVKQQSESYGLLETSLRAERRVRVTIHSTRSMGLGAVVRVEPSPQEIIRSGGIRLSEILTNIAKPVRILDNTEQPIQNRISRENFEIAHMLITNTNAFATLLMLADVDQATLDEIIEEVLPAEDAVDTLGYLKQYGIIEFYRGRFNLSAKGKEVAKQLRSSVK